MFISYLMQLTLKLYVSVYVAERAANELQGEVVKAPG